MKILNLSSSIHGGAGRAASRANDALRASGFDSSLVYISGPESNLKLGQIKMNRNLWELNKSRMLTLAQGRLVQNSSRLVTTYSLDFLKAHANLLHDADVIHIHSMYNFVGSDTLGLFKSLGKKILFTMHDMRLITGGCHYSGKCLNYNSNCNNCPLVRNLFKDRVTKSKTQNLKLLREIPDYTIITPSTWLKNLIMEVPELSSSIVRKIHNPVPDLYFKPTKSSYSEKRRIGFIAVDLNNPYKGLEVLVNALNFLTRDQGMNIELHLMGRGEVTGLDSRIKVVRKDSNDDEVVKGFYQHIDLLCVPSFEDNSPSVITEALSSGVKVIGTNTGGISELLKDFSMKTVKVGSIEELAKGICWTLEREFPPNFRQIAEEKFSSRSYSAKISKLISQ